MSFGAPKAAPRKLRHRFWWNVPFQPPCDELACLPGCHKVFADCTGGSLPPRSPPQLSRLFLSPTLAMASDSFTLLGCYKMFISSQV